MRRIIIFLLLGFISMQANPLHAEGGCPPGMAPYRANDMSSCGPIPGYNQPPPQRWISQWGAIATDFSHGSAGFATNKPSKKEAEAAAVADCQAKGGKQCEVEVAYDNECAAMVVSENHHASTAAPSIEEAIQNGIKVCSSSKDDANCHTYYTACSLPKRIQ